MRRETSGSSDDLAAVMGCSGPFCSFDLAVAKQKLLGSAKWCAVQFFGALHQTEAHAKLVVQRFCVIPNNVEPTAFSRTLWAECADDYMTTRLHSVADLSNIHSTVLARRKKMKHRTVVPYVVSSGLELRFRDIGDEPMDLFCGQTQPLLGHVDSGLRNIEDGDVFMAPCQEVINEGRFASANVNYGCRISSSRALD